MTAWANNANRSPIAVERRAAYLENAGYPFDSMADAAVSTSSHDKILILDTGAALVKTGTGGTPTTPGNEYNDLADGIFCNASGVIYGIPEGDDVTPEKFGGSLQLALNTGRDVLITAAGCTMTEGVAFTADGQRIYGHGRKSILVQNGNNYVTTNGFHGCSVELCKVDGTGAAGFFRITGGSKNCGAHKCWFYKGGQRVWVWDGDYIDVSGNTFEECGYQVIQQAGYASSNCTVQHNFSINCENDFVELNCEIAAPSRNWSILNNICTNIGMVGAVNSKTESRFVGATLVDGLIISGNIVDGCAGDSAVHLERPGRTVISGNLLRNVHGYGYIYLLPGGTAGWSKSHDVVINGNTFIADAAPLGGVAGKVFIRSVDASYFNDINVSNNQFYYYGSDYPADPAVKDWAAVYIGDNLGHTRVHQNYFRSLRYGVRMGNVSGGSPVLTYRPYIEDNNFELCEYALYADSVGNYPHSFENNRLRDCDNVFGNIPTSEYARIARFGGNEFTGMTIAGFSSTLCMQPDWTLNSYQSCTHDDPRAGVTVVHGAATNIVRIPFGYSGVISVSAESVSNASNNRREVFFVSNRGATSVTSLGGHSAGTAPSISLAGTGTNGQVIQITLEGTAVGTDYIVRLVMGH